MKYYKLPVLSIIINERCRISNCPGIMDASLLITSLLVSTKYIFEINFYNDYNK